MEYVVELQTIEKRPVLFVHKETPVAGIGQALGEAYAAIWQHAQRKGVQPSGPPYARYLSVEPDHAVYEAGVPVSTATSGDGEVESGELPGGDVAVTTHVGPFDQMRPAYDAIGAWMREHGRADGGPPWEVYMTDPAEEPDPAKWRTDIVWPLA
jgi:effector-binding domain-containing protein